MSRANALLALTLAVVMVATPAHSRALQAAASTKGTRVEGYTYLTNQADVVALSPTFCNIIGGLFQGNFQGIVGMYNESLAPLVGSTKYSSYPLNKMLYSGGTFSSAADLAATFPKAVATYDFGSIIFSLLYVAKGKIMIDHLDAALRAKQSHVIKNKIDGAYAAFVGNPSLGCYDGPFQLMGLGSPLVGMNYHGNAAASALYMSQIFGNAQFDVSNATVNRANAERILGVYAGFGLQVIRFDSYSADLARVCGNAAVPPAAKSRSDFIWLIVRPLLKGLGATDAALAAFDASLVDPTFNATNAAMPGVSVNGITLSEMGNPIPSLIKTHWVQFGPTFDMTACTATSI